ncbi:Centromere protein P [Anabarilius grahami]|uniref:Centromere protein P n=1 Tax=Anabarilius grahami TaxID=495550 RepID=A0A3N0ZAJ6_ANAGA|nr:Centromere protein P [Anabarilius grahami]
MITEMECKRIIIRDDISYDNLQYRGGEKNTTLQTTGIHGEYNMSFQDQTIEEKYPDVVSLPEGCRSELMIIRSPQLPGISMTIFWKINVSKEGVVKPTLELLLKMTDQARELDTKKVMENGSDYFQSLLQVLGVEASIEALIRTVCL